MFLTPGQSPSYRKMVLALRDGIPKVTIALRPRSIQKMSFQKMVHARPAITHREIIVLNHENSEYGPLSPHNLSFVVELSG